MKIIASMFLVILSSCSLGKSPESSIYAIRAMDLQEQSCKLPLNLQIAEPTTSPGLDSRRIAVYENSQQLNFYSNARWTAPAAEMLQTALVEGFEKAKTFKSVSTDLDAASSDVILLTDIRSFQVEENTINIRYVSKLLDTETRDVIATMEIEKSQAPAAKKIENIVESFADATNDSVKEVIEKTLSAYPACNPKR